MRELKFRAWNKRDKKMEHLDYLNVSKAEFAGNWKVALPEGLFDVATVKGNMLMFKDIIILQYTGLQDRNGVDIYEGDVVTQYEIPSKAYDKKQQVFFHGGMFCVGVPGDLEGPLYFETNTIYRKKRVNLIEVVGNIYENEDLL